MYINTDNLIEKKEWAYIKNVAKVKGGKRLPLGESFSLEGVPYVRAEDIKEYFTNYETSPKISIDLHQKLRRYQTQKNDVLITIVGNSIGDVAITKFDLERCNLTENCAKICDIQHVSPDYVFLFLLSRYGQNQINREKVGTAQPKLALVRIGKFKLPVISERLQETFSILIGKSHNLLEKSKENYHQAQTLLLSEPGLLDWQPKHDLSFVKNYSETEQAGRFDAEYFQPKYDEIAKSIKNYKGGWDTLGNLVSVKKCVEVGSDEYLDEGIPFVRVSNLSPFEITEEKYISEKLYSELTEHQPKQGEILLSKDATPGIAHYLQEKLRKMIPSGGILRLKLKDNRVNEEYLTLVLNSLITKEQINRDVGGSVILHWRPDQVKQTLIPVADKKIQNQIQRKITESFNLRKQSKRLLECAKNAVEMAIEKNEKTATQWLKKQTQNN